MEEQQSRTSMWGVSGTSSKTEIIINEDQEETTEEQESE